MTEINITGNSRRRQGVARAKKHKLRVDMTPMVDLGFILITFFVITVQLSKPMVVKLNMPREGDPTTLGESNALTLLLDENDRLYYYQGSWKEASAKNQVYTTNFSVSTGIGKVIREKQQWLDKYHAKEGRRGLMLLIKPGKGSSYKNVIDALDEAMINTVKKYAVLSADSEETAWMKKQQP